MLDNLVLNSDNINRQQANIGEQFVALKNGLTYCVQRQLDILVYTMDKYKYKIYSLFLISQNQFNYLTLCCVPQK